ncbi:hypothetical protein SASPL_136927 [Salvia splendens]|uniref:Cystatin domain-containing protein n=1 Tax=Salvia splendens TaxID=180675 RepID=A0A8X8X1S3_SALSN|nr:cysteine proteinase inhibitor 5-like [Salvia splendens]KAG6404674.1 hypothetical protein SASPL_136927 [Salvia splendens]
MASSMTMTTSFFGGAVATKPAIATTRPSQLAVRASMDLEKVVEATAETTNTRRGLVLAGMAAVAASSVTKAATAIPGGYTPVKNPSAPEYIILATFAVSEYNKQNSKSWILDTVKSVETQVVNGTNYQLVFTTRDESGDRDNFEAIVYSKLAPSSLELTSFKRLYL